jgi:hypothetical protein
VIFLLQVLKRRSIEKERERERGRKSIEKKKEKRKKAPRVSSNKRGSQYFERRNTSTTKILFYMIPFSPPPSYHFKIFSISLRNFS